MTDKIRLTQYSHAAGCGCKIAPAALEEILKSSANYFTSPHLVVGNNTKDDAAVYDIGNGIAIISTTDFFMPIVDNPIDFGKIAAANAISDIYAMGGMPIMAIAILGLPINKLSTNVAQQIIEGGKIICNEAKIPLAGGHSVDNLEPLFGLAVTGIIDLKNLKKNSTARQGDLIYLTKKIGVGILSTAEKRGKLQDAHEGLATEQMIKLNTFGTTAGRLSYVTAMTDVTGFGLLGHLIEMADGAELTAELEYLKVLLITDLSSYTSQMCIPDNTFRNWNSYEKKVKGITGDSLFTLCDPQTNGGLLITINCENKNDFEEVLLINGLGEFAFPIGRMKSKEKISLAII